MDRLQKITEAELYVMKTLWRSSPLNSTEIINELREQTSWNPKTIHTLISRLVKKGIVGIEQETPQKLYFPLVSESEYINKQTEKFVNRVYNGSFHHLIANFIKEERLSPKELEELKALLDQKGKE